MGGFFGGLSPAPQAGCGCCLCSAQRVPSLPLVVSAVACYATHRCWLQPTVTAGGAGAQTPQQPEPSPWGVSRANQWAGASKCSHCCGAFFSTRSRACVRRVATSPGDMVTTAAAGLPTASAILRRCAVATAQSVLQTPTHPTALPVLCECCGCCQHASGQLCPRFSLNATPHTQQPSINWPQQPRSTWRM